MYITFSIFKNVLLGRYDIFLFCNLPVKYDKKDRLLLTDWHRSKLQLNNFYILF